MLDGEFIVANAELYQINRAFRHSGSIGRFRGKEIRAKIVSYN